VAATALAAVSSEQSEREAAAGAASPEEPPAPMIGFGLTAAAVVGILSR